MVLCHMVLHLCARCVGHTQNWQARGEVRDLPRLPFYLDLSLVLLVPVLVLLVLRS